MTSLDGMDDSLYGEDTPQKPDSETKSVDEEEQMDPEALVNLKVLTGKHGPPKEGDEIVVKVVSIHGDQAVIQYAPEKPEGSESEEAGEREKDEMQEVNSKY